MYERDEGGSRKLTYLGGGDFPPSGYNHWTQQESFMAMAWLDNSMLALWILERIVT